VVCRVGAAGSWAQKRRGRNGEGDHSSRDEQPHCHVHGRTFKTHDCALVRLLADTDLPVLFDKLVNMKESLGVREWGLGQATLEEAFIRICEESGTK
jgi:hypothetical protein